MWGVGAHISEMGNWLRFVLWPPGRQGLRSPKPKGSSSSSRTKPTSFPNLGLSCRQSRGQALFSSLISSSLAYWTFPWTSHSA